MLYVGEIKPVLPQVVEQCRKPQEDTKYRENYSNTEFCSNIDCMLRKAANS